MLEELDWRMIVCVCVILCIGLYMKDKIFPKQVSFDPIIKTADNKDFISSNTFTGTKSGYVFKTGEKGLGYYKDAIEMV